MAPALASVPVVVAASTLAPEASLTEFREEGPELRAEEPLAAVAEAGPAERRRSRRLHHAAMLATAALVLVASLFLNEWAVRRQELLAQPVQLPALPVPPSHPVSAPAAPVIPPPEFFFATP